MAKDGKRFEAKVEKLIEKQKLLLPNSTIVIGVSGGVDSVALLHFLHRYAEKYQWQLVVAHVNHMFRGEESKADYLFVEALCSELGVTFEGTAIDVPAEIAHSKQNSQQVARNCRYQFYRKIMQKHQAGYLALAHHLDDLAETMLMNLTRGILLPKKIGMPVTRPFASGALVRPFLHVEKSEIDQYCSHQGFIYREDSSNQKSTYTRNRFRQRILPFLKEENVLVLEHFADFMTQVHEEDALLQQMAQEIFDQIHFVHTHHEVSFEITSLVSLDKPLQRRILPLILNYLYNVERFVASHAHLEALMQLIEQDHPSGAIDLSDQVQVVRSFQWLYFLDKNQQKQPFEITLQIPGTTHLPSGDTIVAEISTESSRLQDDCHQLIVSAEELPLKVRNKRDGDRIFLERIAGSKQLKKIFREQLVPLHLRDEWPVVVNGHEQIIWVPQLEKCDNMKSTNEQMYVHLKYITKVQLGAKGI